MSPASQAPRLELPEVGLRGMGVHPLSKLECVEYVFDQLRAGRGGWIVAANLDFLLRARREPEFARMCEEASLRVPAGSLLVLACRLQRTPLPERIAVSELMDDFAAAAVEGGRSILMIGDQTEVVERALDALRERHPGLEASGTTYTSRRVEGNPLGVAEVSRQIAAAQPDFVFVGIDSPVQEKLIRFLRHDRPETWWVGAGDGLKVLAGDLEMAPPWMRNWGLEWLHLLRQEPGKYFKRYVVQGLPTGLTLLTGCAFRGTLPKGKSEGLYGKRMPRVLIVDDDKQSLDHLEILLSSRFPELEIETRDEPDISGDYDFYFLDNEIEGERVAASLASRVRAERPQAVIIAFSGLLDLDTLKSLINVGCDGVCDKADPQSWRPILEMMDRRLEQMVERHRVGRHAFGGVRQAAHSIQHLLREWNERDGSSSEGGQQRVKV